MKNLFLALICFISISAAAQHQTPQWGTTINRNNLYAQLGNGLLAINDTNAHIADTPTFVGNYTYGGGGHVYTQYVELTITDSAVLAPSDMSGVYQTDDLWVLLSNSGTNTGWVKFLGYSGLANSWAMSTSGTTKVTLTTGQTALLHFKVFGNYYVEASRTIQ